MHLSFSRGVAIVALLGLAGCETPGIESETVQQAENKPLGADFQVIHYPGLPAELSGQVDEHGNPVASKPADWSITQYKQVQHLWAHGCVAQLKPQLAGTHKKSVAKTTVRTVLGQALGLAIGSQSFEGANAVRYLGYGAGSAAGNALPYGDDAHYKSVNGEGGQCMDKNVYWANERDGQLDGVGTITNYDSVEGNEIPIPPGPAISPTPEEVMNTIANIKKYPPPPGSGGHP